MPKRKKSNKGNVRKKQPEKPEESIELNQDDNVETDEYSDDEAEEEQDDLVEETTVHSTYDNPGWADVISKILAKQPTLHFNQESCILAKATKDFEIVETDQIKRTEKERKEWENLNRLKPNVNDRERERKLAAIASRGVVQLFNTISEQKEQRRKK